ncbi:O-Antigen ligase family protein [Rickettsia felis str. Pedreira]|uniref:Putative polysaccharide ligase RF_0568 n=2 Tax=Rickettsia felis TaxID=42862 RepID=Y568_RICFE|nr:O-antigen ligase [Rickettsia felis]Q4UM04.1 RecName: Full=Putative polysaccharide polymerase RF_0568 [Rickettsia felis URRWXCal2]AAY61419.1 unknown [Rickettsia felis URRWXCal2]KHO02878.1 polysaccharide polymerase [Rickettsia felis str. LSU]KHO03849.1 polysaccharide polymerase [Rickettsia felis]KJV57891.1 O-Antigen ligase family protein [Rickettsia felis str. Pedreira]MDE8611622.1 O-antigen ligase [Rickettsia felis]
MQYLISSLIFLIPSLGMVAGLSVAATVTIFLLMLFLRGINRHCERLKGAWQSHKAGLLRLLRQNLQFFLAMTIKTELLFTAWCFISCLFAIRPINSLATFIQVFILLFLGFTVSNCVPFGNRVQLKNSLILGILTAILLFFIEYSSHGFLTRTFKASFGLYMLDRGCALLSITSWVAIIILLSSGKRRHALMLYILVLYLLSISDSLASFLGFSIGGVIFILARLIKPIFFKLIAISLITGSLLFPVIAKQIEPRDLSEKYLATQPSAAHRLFIWHFVANKITLKPILGYGFASSKYIKVNNSEMINYNGEKWHPLPLHPHNNILQITLELGIIGLILFLCLVYKYLKQINNIKSSNFRAASYSCFINYYIIGMISYNIWQIWWISSGIWVLVLMKLLVKPDIVVDN